jgi:hypothetical protein
MDAGDERGLGMKQSLVAAGAGCPLRARGREGAAGSCRGAACLSEPTRSVSFQAGPGRGRQATFRDVRVDKGRGSLDPGTCKSICCLTRKTVLSETGVDRIRLKWILTFRR